MPIQNPDAQHRRLAERIRARDYPPRAAHRLVPCPGQAHTPEVGGMQDNCSRCAPRWGVVEVLTRAGIQEIAQGRRRGGITAARELARVVDDVLWILWPEGNKDQPWSADRMEELQRALADYREG